jgi:hypothetical protein
MLMAAAIGLAVLNGVLFAWMTALARDAWRALPPGAPVPVHGGVAGWERWRPKERALRLWPIAGGAFWLGSLVILGLVAAGVTGRSAAGADSVAAVLAVALLVLLPCEYLALKAARAVSDQAARP